MIALTLPEIRRVLAALVLITSDGALPDTVASLPPIW